ncbi:hypothetical protein ABID59_005042 [Bradyrhizobium sp. S3.3.6]
MPGLVPGIHVLCTAGQDVDGRDMPGHDEEEAATAYTPAIITYLISTYSSMP